MRVSYIHGIRVGGLSIDPQRRAILALWTHRPRRRPPARFALASAPLADRWPGVRGLPLGRGAVAGGQKVELLPTGYGTGGCAVLMTAAGARLLVVGPTTRALAPRIVDHLVLWAPIITPPTADWVHRASRGAFERIIAPDEAALEVICRQLADHDVPHRRPQWLPGGQRGAALTVATHGVGTVIDRRPQADIAWLVEFAQACEAPRISVHGPAAQPLSEALVAAGLPTRILHAPKQLALGGWEPPAE